MLNTEKKRISKDENFKYNYNFAYNLLYETIPDNRKCDSHTVKEKCICKE